ncbi:serine/threonine-protein kinase KIPK1 [Lactuca sativa]|uniref:non-specific serine/threonine protein kinase n=1 Tax=Lactuca sativa TaxID=4236 RepID=A0A9R1X3P0_LACSA|nr:serine/threonine-protein kinase KIPK1 [Lactuca sativa]XP_023750893.1 serine/threonine-protein kinase KIPK1 [Lactuca sativa]KAJ0199525.1 hypothetical protein LSAT_V11C600324760 [Lactuca sativa]
MGSGTCEIVELEDDPKSSNFSKKNYQKTANDKGKKPQMYTKSIEDDINKLFEAINVRTSFHGFTLDETGANTPRRNPSKKPMRMSTSSSSSSAYPEPVSLKQALRRQCISQASEMAAMKRSSKLPGSPALSDAGKPYITTMYRSSLPPSPAFSDTRKPDITTMKRTSKPPEPPAAASKPPNVHTSVKPSEESTSSSSRKMLPEQQDFKIKSKPDLPQSFLQSTTKKPTKKDETTLRINEILREPESKPSKPINKATLKLRRKGKLKKLIMKKKSPSVPETSHLVCQKCQCALTPNEPNGSNQTRCGPTGSSLYNQNSKHGDKSEFTQSSNSSIGEYSSSTSISEESNMSRCSINNKPHMSMDMKWQAIHRVMKQNGYLGLRNFSLLKKLGCGDIGTVYLAELVGTNCLFAIKVMDNEFLERRKKMPRAHTEREILRILDHPFLPTLYAHFVSENLSCLVMEYCPGGDLHVLRQKQPDRYYNEQAARFYVAEVLLALEYLHMLGIVYRDLKPENILVREDGHIMLTDFDLSLRCTVNPTLLQSGPMDPPRVSGPCAGSNCIDPFCLKPTCQVSCFTSHRAHKPKPDLKAHYPQLVAEPTEARSNSFVGTHEYLAPEIIKGDGHGSAVDWWTFGVFLFELLYGRTPFKGLGNDETLANVVLETLRFPETPIVSFQARDLIKGLLEKSPENRLGSQRGAAEIRRHPFFDGLNWALIRCAVPPEVPEACDVGVSHSVGGGNLQFELF